MAGYIGTKAAVATPGAERKKVFSITTTTTSLTGLAYTPGFVHVFHNGVRLVDGTDYTATNGTSLTLTTAAQNGDEVVVISYATFEVADAYTKAESDDRYVNVTGDTMTGALAVSGNLTVDTDTLFVDAANNRVGVGTSSPAHKLTVAGYSNVDAANKLAIGDNAGYQALIYMESANETLTIENTSDYSGRATIFKDNGTERMRIAPAGLLVGKTTESSTTAGWQFKPSGEAIVGRAASDTVFIFQNSTTGSTVGSISITASSTAYNTSSDYRLKENVAPLADAADRLAQIPVHRFNFIADPDMTVDGFLAHEVQDVVPEAVTGEKDAVDADDNPVYQGIDQSKLVPLLTAALQEALTEITDLKARVEALEAV